jgi:two-component SAPR family response regulator
MSDFGLWNRALSENEIWLLSKDLSQLNSIKRNRLSYWIYGFGGIILFWFYRRRKALLINEPPKMFDDQNKLPIISKPENSTLKSSVQLFGGFRLIDAQGINLISDLSPKIREFLLVLLLYSKKYAEGISNEELTQVLWRGFDTKKATNNRNVSVYKLRTILKDISVIELTFHDNFWRIELSSEIECDYALCLDYLKKLNEANNHNTQSLTEFYSIVSKGRLLPKDQFPWLDSFKEWIETDIIDTLQFIIDQNSATFTKDELIKWIDVLLIFDPINEEMLEKLMKTISDRKLAKHYYNRFANEYKLHFGEDFQTGFSELFD